MFTIDLLKGQGLPMKSRPTGVAISAVAIAVPLIVAMVMLGVYLRNRIIISIEKQKIARCEADIGKLADTVKQQESFERDRSVYSNCLSEVKSCIGGYTQWSPVLAVVAENMPDSVVLTGLDVKQHSIKKKVPKKGDPEKTVDVEVPVRTLRISVSTKTQANSDEAVRNFRARLLSPALLGPKLENINVSQESGAVSGESVVIYQIDCIFKPGM
jgi:hypothetical protein